MEALNHETSPAARKPQPTWARTCLLFFFKVNSPHFFPFLPRIRRSNCDEVLWLGIWTEERSRSNSAAMPWCWGSCSCGQDTPQQADTLLPLPGIQRKTEAARKDLAETNSICLFFFPFPPCCYSRVLAPDSCTQPSAETSATPRTAPWFGVWHLPGPETSSEGKKFLLPAKLAMAAHG